MLFDVSTFRLILISWSSFRSVWYLLLYGLKSDFYKIKTYWGANVLLFVLCCRRMFLKFCYQLFVYFGSNINLQSMIQTRLTLLQLRFGHVLWMGYGWLGEHFGSRFDTFGTIRETFLSCYALPSFGIAVASPST